MAATVSPNPEMTDTIFALSSGRPPAGVAVVRLSGPASCAVAERLAGRKLAPRQAILAALRDPDSGLIDRGYVIAFPAPASFTGEDVVEFQIHGGQAVIAALLDFLAKQPGLRLAEAGEFTRRAFENGKLDLTQAEGLADLIDARTEAQRRQALSQAGGGLRDVADRWRAAIVALMAEAEAGLDFADEDDVDVSDGTGAIGALHDEIATELARAPIGERLRDGLTIAVVGEPNVGKSSLVNILARRPVAIVSPSPGTTRDVIEVALDLGGVPATLIDTAGLREAADPVEAEGIARARARAAEADLVLHVAETQPALPLGQVVLSKCDLYARPEGVHSGGLCVSAKTGAGIADLEQWLVDWATAQLPASEPALITRRRQRDALAEARDALGEAVEASDPVLRAEYLRLASRALAALVGRVGVEEVLGEIFGRFCIGK